MNATELVKLYKAQLGDSTASGAVDKANRVIREAVVQDPTHTDIGQVFEACFGWGEMTSLRRMREHLVTKHVYESGGYVNTAAFQGITGQIVYAEFLKGYTMDEFVITKLIPERQTNILEGEKVAGINDIGDETGIVGEGEEYPLMGVGENYIYLNDPVKRGGILALTREAIIADRTGQLLEKAQKVGKAYGIRREKLACDCLADVNSTDHRYRWLGRTTMATYGDSSGSHNFDNLAASNGLVDYRQVETALQLLWAMTDPFTGEPVMFNPTHIVYGPALAMTVPFVLAPTIKRTSPGYATSSNPIQGEAANPLNAYGLTPVMSKMLAARLTAASQATTNWYLLNPTEMFRWVYNWPTEVTQAPANSAKEFENDIVSQFKVSERGNYSTYEPRAGVKNTA